MELPFFKRKDVTSDIAEKIQILQSGCLATKASIQPSLIFCQRRVPNIDVYVLAYQKHYFFKQQHKSKGGCNSLLNPSCPTSSVLVGCTESGWDGVHHSLYDDVFLDL